MPIVCHGGFFDPPTFKLLESLLTELHRAELPDLAFAVERWIVVHRDLLLHSEQDTPYLRRYRLSDWGELVMHELRSIAQTSQHSPTYVRHRIADTLRWAEGGRPS